MSTKMISDNAREFVERFLSFNNSAKQRAARHSARSEILAAIQINPDIYPRDIKLVVFDMDQTLGLLYPISSTTGQWALSRIIALQKLDADKIYAATRELDAELLCHSPDDFMKKLAETTGLSVLEPSNPANAEIMSDWRDATRTLNQALVFTEIQKGVKKIRDEDGMVYIATNAPLANVIHRMYLWFGANADGLFDGIAVRATLPDMSHTNAYADAAETALVGRLNRDGKIMMVEESKIKPNGYHLKIVLDHANQKVTAKNAAPIKPEEMVLIGDSLSSDGGAARNLRDYTDDQSAQFAYTVQGIVVNPMVHEAHELVGNAVDRLGTGPVLSKIASGDYNRPQVALRDFSGFFEHYHITSAYSVRGQLNTTPNPKTSQP